MEDVARHNRLTYVRCGWTARPPIRQGYRGHRHPRTRAYGPSPGTFLLLPVESRRILPASTVAGQRGIAAGIRLSGHASKEPIVSTRPRIVTRSITHGRTRETSS